MYKDKNERDLLRKDTVSQRDKWLDVLSELESCSVFRKEIDDMKLKLNSITEDIIDITSKNSTDGDFIKLLVRVDDFKLLIKSIHSFFNSNKETFKEAFHC